MLSVSVLDQVYRAPPMPPTLGDNIWAYSKTPFNRNLFMHGNNYFIAAGSLCDSLSFRRRHTHRGASAEEPRRAAA